MMSGVTRPMSRMRKMETKEALFRVRRRHLQMLVLHYLRDAGCARAAEAFAAEAAVPADLQLCDNVDLDIILQDYCSYYLMRFDKEPQFVRRVEPEEPRAVRRPRAPQPAREPPPAAAEPAPAPMFTVTQLIPEGSEEAGPPGPPSAARSLAGFLAVCEPARRPLAEALYREVVRHSAVAWDDVKGLDDAKRLLLEAVVYPVRHPSLFTGALSPWRGVLLHGPPGGGKTLLARAAAAGAGVALLNVACSAVVSKWRGESEKIVNTLFDLAHYLAPSIVFIDELETLAARGAGGAGGGGDAARRLRAQLLVELDGVATRDTLVLLLANTNMPWEIDPAMLRRLEKRIYVPLPDERTRRELFAALLRADHVQLDATVDLSALAAATEGYSGSDIKAACKEALMNSVRRLLPCTAAGAKSLQAGVKHKLSHAEVLAAVHKTRPAASSAAADHQRWQDNYGCS